MKLSLEGEQADELRNGASFRKTGDASGVIAAPLPRDP
jgi:hypothetical protein